MARQWLYQRLPRGLNRSIVDSLLDSYGDTEQQAELLAEAGSPVADASRWYPFQEGGQWKIGPGIPIGPVDNLDDEQSEQLGRWQSEGMLREAGYARLIEHAQGAQANVQRQLKRANIPDVPKDVQDALAEVYLYEESQELPAPVVRSIKQRDYAGAFEGVQQATNAPAPVIEQATTRAVEAGNASGTEGLVTEVLRNTAINETGRADYSRMGQIAQEANGTKSYGILGLNSGANTSGTTFVAQHGERLGLTAAIGSDEFDQQWLNLSRNNPEALIDAHEEYVQSDLIAPAQTLMTRNGLGAHREDPGMINMVSDMIVQYGPGLTAGNLKDGAAKGSTDTQSVIRDITQATVDNVDRNFRTHLGQFPEQRQGLINRLENRGEQSVKLSANFAPTNDRPPTVRAPNAAPVTDQSPINVASNGGDASLPFTVTPTSPESSAPVETSVATQIGQQLGGVADDARGAVERFQQIPELAGQLFDAGAGAVRDASAPVIDAAGNAIDSVTNAATNNPTLLNLGQNLRRFGSDFRAGLAGEDPNARFDQAQEQLLFQQPVVRDEVLAELDALGNSNPDIQQPRNGSDFESEIPVSSAVNREIAQPAATPISAQDRFEQDRALIEQFVRDNAIQQDVSAAVDQQLADRQNELRENALARVLGLSQSNARGASTAINSGVNNLDRLRASLGTGETPRTQVQAPPQLSATSLVNTLGALRDLNEFGDAQDRLQATNSVLGNINAGAALTGNPALSLIDTLNPEQQANSLFNTVTQSQRLRQEALAANELALQNVGQRNGLLGTLGRLSAINGQLDGVGVDAGDTLDPIFDNDLIMSRFRDNNNTVAR